MKNYHNVSSVGEGWEQTQAAKPAMGATTMTKQSIMDALKLHNVFCYAIAEGVMAEEVYTINGVSGSGWRFFLANTTMQEVKDWLGY